MAAIALGVSLRLEASHKFTITQADFLKLRKGWQGKILKENEREETRGGENGQKNGKRNEGGVFGLDRRQVEGVG